MHRGARREAEVSTGNRRAVRV